MSTYKTAYVVTTNNGNEFMIKQSENLGLLTIDAFNACPGRKSNFNCC